MSAVKKIIAVLVGGVVVAVVVASFLVGRPVTYRVEGVRVQCHREVADQCPTRDQWRAFAVTECERWTDAGELQIAHRVWGDLSEREDMRRMRERGVYP